MFTWASGNQYEGGYLDDERNGYGKMIFTDGMIYEGNWMRGIQSGEGKIKLPDGTIKQGYFKSGVFYDNSVNYKSLKRDSVSHEELQLKEITKKQELPELNTS